MKQVVVVLLALILSGCSSWVYKLDIPQGNFLNQDDVDKLRVDMTKEQVSFVLGTSLLLNPFKEDNWHYVYTRRSGLTDETLRRELIVEFENDKVKAISGDYKVPENFNVPLDAE
jgi:outer membrane protein assembly factor BamE